jgi:hypothetical protein
MRGIPIYGPDGQTVSPQTNRDEWLTVRGPLMGSSDLAALLGKDEYQGPWEIWDRIVLGRWGAADGADIRRGNRQEGNAIKRFEEVFGLQTIPVGMIAHPADQRIVSDLDAMVLRPETWPEAVLTNPLWDHVRENCEGHGALEAKVPRTARFYKYRDEGMMVGHAIQMQQHLEVAGLEWGALTFFNPEYDDSIAFPVVAEEHIGTWIRAQIPAWYARYVDTRERPMSPMPPPPRWPATVPGVAEVREDAAWLTQAEFLALRWYELIEAQENYHQTEEKLLELLAEEDQHVVGGGVVVKRTTSGGRRNFDRKRFMAALMLAQMEYEENGDVTQLMALDDKADEFYNQSAGKDTVEVKVVGGNPAEMGG